MKKIKIIYTRIRKYTKNIRYFFQYTKIHIREKLVKYTNIHDIRNFCLDYISSGYPLACCVLYNSPNVSVALQVDAPPNGPNPNDDSTSAPNEPEVDRELGEDRRATAPVSRNRPRPSPLRSRDARSRHYASSAIAITIVCRHSCNDSSQHATVRSENEAAATCLQVLS